MTTLATNYPMEPGETKRFGINMKSGDTTVIHEKATYRVIACKQVSAGLYHIDFDEVVPEKKRRAK